MNRIKQQLEQMSGARIVLIVGVLALALVPAPAFAHDNLGGDELAVANWMFVAAVVTIALGALWALWAIRSGQFNNIEQSKYTMLENSEDYDAIMAEYDAREIAAKEASSPSKTNAKVAPGAPVQPDAAPTRNTTGTTSGKTANA